MLLHVQMGGASNRFFTILSTTTTTSHPFHRFPSLLRLSRQYKPPLFPSSLSFLSHRHSLPSRPSSSASSFPPGSSHHFHSHSPVSSAYPSSSADSATFPASHPWPEWSHLLNSLSAAGYNGVNGQDEFTAAVRDLPEDFMRAASVCLAFARQRAGLLRLLSRRDLEVVVENGTPFLFQNGDDSARRMRLFLGQGSTNSRSSDNFGESARPFEMKRGDWICQRCNFMNFARNMKCLECEEARPKRELTGKEWECPQCDFFNYGRNMVCLRCDCKRPREVSHGSTNDGLDMGYVNMGDKSQANIDSRLAANEEKAQRWFSKISQLDSTSDMSSAVSDEDFPEIMPLRKGVNRFVVSTRKTPLERRLANAQYQRNVDNEGNYQGKDLQSGSVNRSLGRTPNRTLDEILGRVNTSTNPRQNVGTDTPSSISSSVSSEYGQPRGGNSNYPQFVPLPADSFAKKPENSSVEESMQLSEKPPEQAGSKDEERDQAEKSERWFNRVAELHDVTDLASAVSDEDFPEIMPMRKGENRFVVSKKKDRSLTTPAYKRRTATEQPNSGNYVPFVPFPPDYFAKKKNQQTDLTNKIADETTSTTMPDNSSDSLVDARPHVQQVKNQQSNVPSWNSENSGQNQFGDSAPSFANSSSYGMDRLNIGSSGKEKSNQTAISTGNSPQQSNDQNIRQGWSGKSLEGSAVKEPDPLDMSEEAKAERWFKRVAQIKDISELSQIPDEDFPSIMPMRKGVNRFVVSKRKTPLERRLTSPQYRKNLPVVSSDPAKERDSD